MKILSANDWAFCNSYLRVAKNRLEFCLRRMKGKYGPSSATRDILWAINDIDALLSDDPMFKYSNKYKNPPNTPKSRRLGWYKKGDVDER